MNLFLVKLTIRTTIPLLSKEPSPSASVAAKSFENVAGTRVIFIVLGLQQLLLIHFPILVGMSSPGGLAGLLCLIGDDIAGQHGREESKASAVLPDRRRFWFAGFAAPFPPAFTHWPWR